MLIDSFIPFSPCYRKKKIFLASRGLAPLARGVGREREQRILVGLPCSSSSLPREAPGFNCFCSHLTEARKREFASFLSLVGFLQAQRESIATSVAVQFEGWEWWEAGVSFQLKCFQLYLT